MIQINLFVGQEQRSRDIKNRYVHRGGDREGGTNYMTDTNTLSCVRQIASENCWKAQEAQLGAL